MKGQLAKLRLLRRDEESHIPTDWTLRACKKASRNKAREMLLLQNKLDPSAV